MIRALYIENYILINSLNISFERGLNTITGETGAGKSILLGAVSLILCARGDSSYIRDMGRNLVLEGEFSVESVAEFIEPLFVDADIEFSNIITIRRIITPSGKSKCYVNDEPTTVTFLKNLTPYLVDVHSQHQTLLLSNSNFQTDILDAFCGAHKLLKSYKGLYNAYIRKCGEIELLREMCAAAKRDSDYIDFQLNQLLEANLTLGEKEELEHERDILSNASQIEESVHNINSFINMSDAAVIPQLQSAKQIARKIEEYLPKDDNIVERLTSSLEELKDISRTLDIFVSTVQSNPARVEFIDERLDTITTLEHKHSVSSVEELIALREEFELKRVSIDNNEEALLKAESELHEVEREAWGVANELTKVRIEAGVNLAKKVVEYLKFLGMPKARFNVDISPLVTLSGSGCDSISFTFAANSGSPLESIYKVASGGEMSRLMLALKAIASERGALPTIIFDEIDSGVSGKVADMVGQLIEKLSQRIQVINITHLPQIASKGEHHYYIYKEDNNEHSESKITKLSSAERINEIAVMLSGSSVTEAAIKQAKQLLKK